MFSSWSLGHRGLAAAAFLMLTLGLYATAARIIYKYQTPGPPDPINEGYCDFHNGIYFPSKAMVEGISPYGARYANEFPVARQIPFFSPSIVALHAPLALLPLRLAEVAYFAAMLAMALAISMQSITASGLEKRWDLALVVAAAIVFSRAGHVTFFNGYFTFELVLATIIAVRYAPSRPVLAGIALLVISAKPTYVLPLGLLMLARGNVRALIYGATLSIAGAALPFIWLAWNEGNGNVVDGITVIKQQIIDSQAVHHLEPNELPVRSWTRIDLFAIIAKWTEQDPSDVLHLGVMMLVLLIPMMILFRLARDGIDDNVAGFTGALIMTSMIVGLYRQSYDALLLTPPILGALAGRVGVWQSLSKRSQLIVALVMLFPAYNYLSTQMILGRFELPPVWIRLVTSVNAVVMAGLLIWLIFLFRRVRNGALPPYS